MKNLMSTEINRPIVGVATILRREGKVLIGKRIGSNGANTRGFAGGHLEFGEEIEACAARELMEETGLQAKNLSIVAITNDIMQEENKHYITIYVVGDYISGEATICEPDKFSTREWCSRDNLPTDIFSPIKNLLKQNYNPFG